MYRILYILSYGVYKYFNRLLFINHYSHDIFVLGRSTTNALLKRFAEFAGHPIYIHTNIYKYVHTCRFIHTYTYACIYMYVCMYVCMYVYITHLSPHYAARRLEISVVISRGRTLLATHLFHLFTFFLKIW